MISAPRVSFPNGSKQNRMLSATALELFFFNDTATTEIYTLSLHDALPISFSLVPLHSGRINESAKTLLPRSWRSEEHTSELQSQSNIVCRLLLEKKNEDVSRQRAGAQLRMALEEEGDDPGRDRRRGARPAN